MFTHEDPTSHTLPKMLPNGPSHYRTMLTRADPTPKPTPTHLNIYLLRHAPDCKTRRTRANKTNARNIPSNYRRCLQRDGPNCNSRRPLEGHYMPHTLRNPQRTIRPIERGIGPEQRSNPTQRTMGTTTPRVASFSWSRGPVPRLDPGASHPPHRCYHHTANNRDSGGACCCKGIPLAIIEP